MYKLITLFVFLITAQAQAQLIPFRINDLWGYSDTAKKIKIKPQFQFADFFYNDFAFVKKDSLFYGVNSKGKIITEGIEYYGEFINGLCPVHYINGKSAYINSSGRETFLKTFNAAENFSEDLAVVQIDKKLGIINTEGEWVRTPNFDTSSRYFKSGYLMAISKGKYFYINRKGNKLTLADSVEPGGIFSEGLAPVYVTKQRNSEGMLTPTIYLEFIDTSGKIVLSHFENEGLDYSEYIALEKEFRDGKAVIKSRNDIGWDYFLIDKKKQFSPLYSSVRQLGDSLYLGAIGYYMSEVRILDKDHYVAGQFQSKPTQVGEFGDGLLAFRDNDGYWGYINSNCRTIIENKYTAAFTFENGFAFIVLNGKYGVINTKGVEFFLDQN
jgi:hypothetical protein